ncbi:Uncharacterised protein [Mycobacteroides abscessus subsp. abscessus]|nr:Uncharacterised protein [Mycobacteroides abscessus subsp. abscessus]
MVQRAEALTGLDGDVAHSMEAFRRHVTVLPHDECSAKYLATAVYGPARTEPAASSLPGAVTSGRPVVAGKASLC